MSYTIAENFKDIMFKRHFILFSLNSSGFTGQCFEVSLLPFLVVNPLNDIFEFFFL